MVLVFGGKSEKGMKMKGKSKKKSFCFLCALFLLSLTFQYQKNG